MEVVYFIVGPVLAVLAVLLSFMGLRNERFGASPRAFRVLLGGMAALIVVTVVGAVLNARHEQKIRRVEVREYKAKQQEQGAKSEPNQ